MECLGMAVSEASPWEGGIRAVSWRSRVSRPQRQECLLAEWAESGQCIRGARWVRSRGLGGPGRGRKAQACRAWPEVEWTLSSGNHWFGHWWSCGLCFSYWVENVDEKQERATEESPEAAQSLRQCWGSWNTWGLQLCQEHSVAKVTLKGGIQRNWKDSWINWRCVERKEKAFWGGWKLVVEI